MLEGGCSCGRIRYEAHGAPFHATLCHCSDCRRATAAPFVAWFSVRAAALRVVSGQPRNHASSAKAVRSFCPDCGTPLFFRSDDLPDEVDVATCSLDHPEQVPPTDHVRAAGRLSWVHLSDGLPQHQGARAVG